MSEEGAALAKARSLVAIRRWQEALQALGPAVGNEATAVDAHCLRAQCLLGLGQPGEAVTAARQALALRPDSAWAHRLLGVAYLRTRQRRAAYAEASEAVRLEPKSVHALHLLSACQLARRQRAAAEQTARVAVAENPQHPLAHLTLGQAAAARQENELAENAYREGLRLAPDNGDLALGLARLLHRLGRRDEAAEAYLAAGRANPADARARQGLARLGLPVAGVGALAAVKILLLVGAQHAVVSLRPIWAAVVIGGCLLLACAVTTLLRLRGTRKLPEAVRAGLRGDHRNAALRWLLLGVLAALVLAVWAAALPAAKGGGLAETAGFAVFAIAAGYVVHRFWVGPRRSLAERARALTRPNLRGR